MEYALNAVRLKGLLKAKRLKRKDLVAAGFSASQVDEWLYPRAVGSASSATRRPNQPSGPDAVRLALLCEAPVEYLFGAPTEYDGLPCWEVAARASFEHFLRRTSEGRRVASLRPTFERHLEAFRERAPMTSDAWRALADVALLAQTQQAEEIRGLNDSLRNQTEPRENP